MKTVTYSNIAEIYDLADFRHVTSIDPNLDKIAKGGRVVKVLDLGCGTGSYLLTQGRYINSAMLIGLDYCYEMIKRAKRKGLVNLFVANAEDGIPLANSVLDYITCRFAFHHFAAKALVLAEAKRCLRTGGMIHMYNVEPHSNRKWWVYELFPEVMAEDLARFWKPDFLVGHLIELGFSVDSKIHIAPETMTKSKMLERLRLRDTSQLHMIDNEVYRRKLCEVEKWPEDKCIVGDSAFLTIKAVKMSFNAINKL